MVRNTIVEGPGTIIGADVHARSPMWHNPTRNARGKIIEELVKDNHLTVINTPRALKTYERPRMGASNIDVTLTTADLQSKIKNGMWTDTLQTATTGCWRSRWLVNREFIRPEPDITRGWPTGRYLSRKSAIELLTSRTSEMIIRGLNPWWTLSRPRPKRVYQDIEIKLWNQNLLGGTKILQHSNEC